MIYNIFCKICLTRKEGDYLENQVRVYRAKRKLSQLQLSDISGVSRQTISSIEHGSAPSFETAQKLAEALGDTVDVIFLSNLSYKSYNDKEVRA